MKINSNCWDSECTSSHTLAAETVAPIPVSSYHVLYHRHPCLVDFPFFYISPASLSVLWRLLSSVQPLHHLCTVHHHRIHIQHFRYTFAFDKVSFHHSWDKNPQGFPRKIKPPFFLPSKTLPSTSASLIFTVPSPASLALSQAACAPSSVSKRTRA